MAEAGRVHRITGFMNPAADLGIDVPTHEDWEHIVPSLCPQALTELSEGNSVKIIMEINQLAGTITFSTVVEITANPSEKPS